MNTLTTRIFARENGKWIFSRKEQTRYSFFRFQIKFSLVIGIGYFTSYEDDKILQKTFLMPFFMINNVYEKSKIIISL